MSTECTISSCILLLAEALTVKFKGDRMRLPNNDLPQKWWVVGGHWLTIDLSDRLPIGD